MKDNQERVSIKDNIILETGTELSLIAKHLGGGEFMFKISSTSTVGDLKRKLEELTSVRTSRQKLVGLEGRKKIKLSDEFKLAQLELKNSHKFTMIGTADDKVIKDPHELDGELPEVINDLDDDSVTVSEEDISAYVIQDQTYNLRELKKRLDSVECNIHLINEPRREKKLCVIDIDYTIFDSKSTHNYEVTTELLLRPYCEEFLTQIYKDFDICFWSQTSWRWLEAKLTEMSILTSPNYKISFVLDKTTMIEVTSKVRGGKLKRHHVKPLEFIWQKLGTKYNINAKNTVHIDDLSRNFAMNPSNGIKVTAFRDCANNRDDTELLQLANYLTNIVAHAKDVRKLELHKWKSKIN
jgi:ubiquitin-like domain-containing CTD phosphatase 1